MTTPSHAELVDAARRWLRDCPVVVICSEVASVAGETPDAIGWSGGASWLVECKTSRSDFKTDARKPWRRNPEDGMGGYRYYLAPKGLLAVSELPPGWGLLEYHAGKVREVHKAVYRVPGKRSARGEIALLVSVLRRVGQHAPDAVSIRCYTFQTQNRAALDVRRISRRTA